MSFNPFHKFKEVRAEEKDKYKLKKKLMKRTEGKYKLYQKPQLYYHFSLLVGTVLLFIFLSYQLFPNQDSSTLQHPIHTEQQETDHSMKKLLLKYEGQSEHWTIQSYGYRKVNNYEGLSDEKFENGYVLLKYRGEKHPKDQTPIILQMGNPNVYFEKQLVYYNRNDVESDAAILNFENILPSDNVLQSITFTINWQENSETITLEPNVVIKEHADSIPYWKLDKVNTAGYVESGDLRLNASLKNWFNGMSLLMNDKEHMDALYGAIGDEKWGYFEVYVRNVTEKDLIEIKGVHETGEEFSLLKTDKAVEVDGTFNQRVEFNFPKLGRWQIQLYINGEKRSSVNIEAIYM